MTRRNNAELQHLDIPPEKAEVIARLREMERGGWEALRSMSYSELDGLEAEVEPAYVYQNSALVHPHNQMRLDGLSAITAEKSRRYQEFAERSRQTTQREANINEAAEGARKAVELLEHALKLDKGLPDPVPEPPALDVTNATDGELKGVAATCRGIIDERVDYNETKHERLTKQAEAIGMIKSKAARTIAAELMERAGKYAERIAKAESLLDEIQAEQARREEERREAAAVLTPEAMEARIRDLERKLAGE